MSDLNGGFAIEVRIVCQHAAEHRDVGCGVGTLEDEIGRDLSLFIGEFPFRQIECGSALLRADEGELRRARRRQFRCLFAILGGLLGRLANFAEHFGDFARDRIGLFWPRALIQKMPLYFLAEPLCALAKMSRQRFLECIARAHGALQSLRGDAQTLDAAEEGGFRPAGVVAIEVGRRIESQKMELNESRHCKRVLRFLSLQAVSVSRLKSAAASGASLGAASPAP